MSPLATSTITIRTAYSDDDVAVTRLAQLDSADQLPPRPLLLAEVDGELRAALSLRDGSTIADPFFPTVDLLALLHKHASVTGATAVRRHRPRARALRLRLQLG
jgi:hypothetical protein